jgi:hypothetical protein
MLSAIRDLQHWFYRAMGDGTTFGMAEPIVEVYHTPHPAAWYSEMPHGDYSVWFWHNVLDDGFAATGGGFFDPMNTWLFYIDADPACDQLTGGTSGVALLPANDLRGLAGEALQPVCPNQEPDTRPRCRWVGGLGHELGHAFYLPHPPGCPGPDSACPNDALMWLGYTIYPDTYLLQEDIATLSEGTFFHPAPAPPEPLQCADALRLGDVTADGSTNVDDLISIILAWGPCPEEPEPCFGDLNGDGLIDVDDLVLLILAWDR